MNAARIAVMVLVAVATLAGTAFAALFTTAMVSARADPQSALARWPVDTAKAATATVLLATTPSRAQVDRAAALGEAVLARTPVNAEAARNVAMSRLLRGDLAQARRIIALGEALSRRDVPTQTWLIEDRAQAGDINGALAHYDRALRTSRDSRAILLPVLAQAANDPAIARPLAARLTSRPEWWSDFLGRFTEVATSPVAIRLVADGLKLDLASDIDHGRVAQILARLVALGAFAEAKAYHGRATGLGAAAVVDPGFERDHGLAPFDWQLVDEADRSATRDPRDGARGTALSVSGTEGREVARQLLVLRPGRYRLQATSGSVAAETLAPPAVSLACAAAGTTPAIASANFPSGQAPRRWGMTITVPAGCRAQWLSISSASNVGYSSENPWIDDIAIVPVEARRQQ